MTITMILVPLHPVSLTHKNPKDAKEFCGMCPVGRKDWSIDLKMFFCRNILFVWFLWLFLWQLSFQWKCLPQFSESCSPLCFQTFCTWWHSKWFCHWPWYDQELSKSIWVPFLSCQAWVQNLWVLHWELQIKNSQNLLNVFYSDKNM